MRPPLLHESAGQWTWAHCGSNTATRVQEEQANPKPYMTATLRLVQFGRLAPVGAHNKSRRRPESFSLESGRSITTCGDTNAEGGASPCSLSTQVYGTRMLAPASSRVRGRIAHETTTVAAVLGQPRSRSQGGSVVPTISVQKNSRQTSGQEKGGTSESGHLTPPFLGPCRDSIPWAQVTQHERHLGGTVPSCM